MSYYILYVYKYYTITITITNYYITIMIIYDKMISM